MFQTLIVVACLVVIFGRERVYGWYKLWDRISSAIITAPFKFIWWILRGMYRGSRPAQVAFMLFVGAVIVFAVASYRNKAATFDPSQVQAIPTSALPADAVDAPFTPPPLSSEGLDENGKPATLTDEDIRQCEKNGSCSPGH